MAYIFCVGNCSHEILLIASYCADTALACHILTRIRITQIQATA